MRSFRFSVCTALLILQLSLTATFARGDEVLRSRFEAANQGFSIQFGKDTLVMVNQLHGLYGARNFDLIWFTEGGQVQPAVATLLDAIKGVEGHGLEPEDYHLGAITSRLQQLSENNADALALRDLDMLLSDALLLLATHLQRGKTDPKVIDPQWDGSPVQPEWLQQSMGELAKPLTPESLSGFLADRLPRDAGYARLQAARQRLSGLVEAEQWTAIGSESLLRPGGKDDRVPKIRQRLIQLGDLAENSIVIVDGNAEKTVGSNHYSTDLSAAVMDFQRRHGLEADGVIGPQSVAALNMSPEERVSQIDVNLERWRWMPRELGQRHVVVNIAGFEMRLIDQGQPTLIKPVVVGRDYRRTPVFSDRIRYLVLNPDWVVPPKLAVQDKLPEIRRSPDYLQRLGYRIYDGWGANRQVIDPASVDWSTVSARNFPYRLVQEPGPLNALGQVKFMFPNQYNVYLHDTPARELFRRSERAFSSGCVRVQDPLQLTALLLEREGWSQQRLDDTIAAGRTQTVNLKEPVPVHIQYWTSWVGDDARLQFRKDIYQRDDAIRMALRTSI